MGHSDIVLDLIEAGCDKDAPASNGWTPLLAAAAEGHTHVVRHLLSAGANIDASTKSGQTPLHLAATFGYPTIVNLLVSAGANVNASDASGWHALMEASAYGHGGIVFALIKAGANMEAADVAGNKTSLWLAAQRGHSAAVYHLVHAGARMEVRDCCGWTPLHISCFWGHEEVVSILLKAGANRFALAGGGAFPAFAQQSASSMFDLVDRGTYNEQEKARIRGLLSNSLEVGELTPYTALESASW
mmetsp:Transcript_48716/g.121686  ORF Transcript_48716/g.121686 Transcript_48716/m.121686 type:complete len:245 (+) Transcript_48716:410-1144(+)